jgi:hypothetical protein
MLPIGDYSVITVKAKLPGYYHLMIQKPGDIFTIPNERAFSKKWMERVEIVASEEPDQTTLPKVPLVPLGKGK